MEAIAIGADDSVVMGGTKNGSFAVTKLASNGTELWTWEVGSPWTNLLCLFFLTSDGRSYPGIIICDRKKLVYPNSLRFLF